MSTSLTTAEGTWAVLPMGYLDQPLNTFWQLFFRAPGAAGWSDQVQATAVATNGGLVLASAGQSLAVGILPSRDLTFSPLISTLDGGKTWSNGLIDARLAARPAALATSPSGGAVAVVGAGGQTSVLTASGILSSWRTLTTQGDLAGSAAGRTCGLRSITSVALASAATMVGGSCSQPGVIGIFASAPSGWRLISPPLPTEVARDDVEVLSLQVSSAGLAALLAVGAPGGTSLLVASSGDLGASWSTSEPLRLGAGESVASFGPSAGASGYFVLLGQTSGLEDLEVLSGTGAAWSQLPPPPAATATVAFLPGSGVDALAASDTTLTVWSLGPTATAWAKSQTIAVPIEFGSSS
jgi:hypothetical protein